ncbi:MAG: hypothetical protein AAFY29_11680 [Pseudomonadota bacterium]
MERYVFTELDLAKGLAPVLTLSRDQIIVHRADEVDVPPVRSLFTLLNGLQAFHQCARAAASRSGSSCYA